MMRLQGIRKAVQDFNGWQGCAVVMVDTSSGEIWTDIFSSGNEWKQYHSDTIFKVTSKVRMDERDDRTTMKKVRQLIEERF